MTSNELKLRSKRTGIGLTSLFLLMCSTACSKQVRPAVITPPAALLADCPETKIMVATNGDLVLKLRSLRVDLQSCNADKEALRSFFSSMTPVGR